MEAIPDETYRALVVAGGEPWTGQLPRFGASIARVIAADSGVELALQLGIPVDVVVGDLDSASPAALREAERQGARLERHPVDKDATDLELAMDLACEDGADTVVVVGGAGGRLSHLLGIANLLASAKYQEIAISWLLPHAEAHVVNRHHQASLDGQVGDLVSLIPIGGAATGITTTGLRWVLDEDTLSSSSTRGISNELVAGGAAIGVGSGTLLVVHERNVS